MADTYVNAAFQTGATDPYPNAAKNSGAAVNRSVVVFEFDGTQSNGDVFRVVKAISAEAILVDAWLSCDALTGMTDVDMGLYRVNGGAVVDKDIIMDGKTFATALRKYQAQDIANIDTFAKKLYELANETEADHDEAYDIALTLNAAGSASGTCVVSIEWIQG